MENVITVKEYQRLKDENKVLRMVLEETHHTLTKARIWGGMDWYYNPLHPMYYVPALVQIRQALDTHYD